MPIQTMSAPSAFPSIAVPWCAALVPCVTPKQPAARQGCAASSIASLPKDELNRVFREIFSRSRARFAGSNRDILSLFPAPHLTPFA
ncbi:hypothetical protein, partial [Mesorhizobium sp. M7A.T.Ca.US.000.02.1.1]|uniref:hypothetical protein n=1 Tax=Mesorhizobium sp. M7A.T.Ca.US.000.02.1.1 TaxID=2496792 RepID=UPI0019D41E3C